MNTTLNFVGDLSKRAAECQINSTHVPSLFQVYETNNPPLLYPEKKQKLEPYIKDLVRFYQILQNNPELFKIFSYGNPGDDRFASLVLVKTASQAYFAQHMVSADSFANALISFKLAELLKLENYGLQKLFRPDNRFSNRFYGEEAARMINRLAGREVQSVVDFDFYEIDRTVDLQKSDDVVVKNVGFRHRKQIEMMAVESCDAIWAKSDGFFDEDLHLKKLGRSYGESGLEWGREFWFASSPDSSEPQAMAIRYMGPKYLNMRDLFNRTEVLVKPGLDQKEQFKFIRGLMGHLIKTHPIHNQDILPFLVRNNAKNCIDVPGLPSAKRYRKSSLLPEGMGAANEYLYSRYFKLLLKMYKKGSL